MSCPLTHTHNSWNRRNHSVMTFLVKFVIPVVYRIAAVFCVQDMVLLYIWYIIICVYIYLHQAEDNLFLSLSVIIIIYVLINLVCFIFMSICINDVILFIFFHICLFEFNNVFWLFYCLWLELLVFFLFIFDIWIIFTFFNS